MSDMITNPENVTESAAHRDAITATANPRPWRVADIDHDHDILDADGKVAARAAHGNKELAAFIVEAVNERERLRDIVRRLADTLQGILDAAEGRGVGRLDEGLVREARAALGEEANRA